MIDQETVSKERLNLKYNTISFLVAFNVYSLHFVERYWLKESALSPQGKYSTSLSILLIVHSSIALFINYYYPNINWRLIIAIGSIFNIAVALLFDKIILKNVKEYYVTSYPKYSIIFLCWVATGLLCLVLLIFLNNYA